MPLALAVNLLEKMLVFDPQERIDCVHSLEHRYMAEYHDLADEPVAEKFGWAFSDADFPVHTWKAAISSEIAGASPSAVCDFPLSC
jgi:p38 MAP kinase